MSIIAAGETCGTAIRVVHGRRWREGWGSERPIVLVVSRDGNRSRMVAGGARVHIISVIKWR
jgi:hypothetical protein